jgi:hypothetical protein
MSAGDAEKLRGLESPAGRWRSTPYSITRTAESNPMIMSAMNA